MTAVWLHSAGQSAAAWYRGRLGGGLALDLPGHAQRPRAPEPSLDAFDDAILPDCQEGFDIVGRSLGGMPATRVLGPSAVGLPFSRGTEGATREALRRENSTPPREGLCDALTTAMGFPMQRYRGEIAAPTVVLAAAENNVTGPQGRRIANATEDARFEEMPGGHLPHTDCLDQFYPRVAAFPESRA